MKRKFQVPVWITVEADTQDEAWHMVANALMDQELHTNFTIEDYIVEEPQEIVENGLDN